MPKDYLSDVWSAIAVSQSKNIRGDQIYIQESQPYALLL